MSGLHSFWHSNLSASKLTTWVTAHNKTTLQVPKSPEELQSPYPILLPQMVFQEIDGQGPGRSRGLRITHAMIGIGECVPGIIHLHGDVFARRFVHPLNLLNLCHRDAIVSATINSQHGSIDLCYFLRRGIVATAIEGNNRTQVGVTCCHGVGQETANAE